MTDIKNEDLEPIIKRYVTSTPSKIKLIFLVFIVFVRKLRYSRIKVVKRPTFLI